MIEARHLTKVFDLSPARARRTLDAGPDRARAVREAGGVLAVDDVSFSVERGELFVIMGLSGSGKSTVIRMINRLVVPTTGSVLYDGTDVGGMTPRQLRGLRNERVGMVFQHFALFPHRTVRENAAYGLKARGVPRRERLRRADRALEQVGLGQRGGAYPDEFSGGMQQRVGLARALTTDPDVLIMDEPFSALDPLTRRSMQEQLLELQRDFRKTIIFVTHDLNEAMRLGDRIMVMRDGRTIQLGTGPEIIARPADGYVHDFVSDVDRTRVLTAAAVMRPPWVTAALGEDPAAVLARLERSRARGAYVTAPDGGIAGVATPEALSAAAAERRADLEHCLGGDYTAVPDDTPLVEFCHLTGGHAVPLAVVDRDKRLVGVVPRARVLDAIASAAEDRSEHA
ncbi:quaternary amine ABC transporter ATP-binding protein [Marinitenerispora sediminis]|uniref:Glycine betaine/L-proline ABC transporter ATP-binding protein n=1 Tax=Marinitenerispora sediminis TaxID=1931232 RepID=A0A368T4C6_9ACTN|nr:betaine/proline/choline family ABC transporter ATP-binding protein [Marinitenerispora sediminis]RCV57585.1 glycine betaine/L-proline ABC transporter ATP-binding protein [Marinitenerispora sediminis]RCV58300.1 glycine betaine/L-proline ABC transporter ATP-binding protein [Marinitenerispora sediminis]RCV59668.1 glycine betaine/L-proline ABC transporter ATP-binding protein [Marinitenerispora sediminis]